MKKLETIRTELLVLALLSLSAFRLQSDFVFLLANTPVILVLDSPIDSEDLGIGDLIRFKVEQSVSVSNRKVISTNAPAYGRVVKLDADVLVIEMEFVTAINDAQVPIRRTIPREKNCRKCTIKIQSLRVDAQVKENTKIEF
jgi:hypothetical protein